MFRAVFVCLALPFRFIFFLIVKARARHRDLTLEMTLKADFTEAPLSHGIWAYFKPAKDRFYLLALELASALSQVENKKIRLKKIRLCIEPHNLGWAQAWELRSLLARLRAAGVTVQTYLLSDDKISAFIASASDKIMAPETVALDFSPFTSESVFVQSLLAKLGVRPQFLSVGEFKSAAEIFTRTGMSPAARKQTEELIADLENAFFSALAEKAPTLAEKKNRGIVGIEKARATGFIDAALSFSEFSHAAEKERCIDLYALDKLIRRKMFRLFNFRKPVRVALIVAEGNIVESAESRPGTINWPDYEQISAALREEEFDGAIVRVNSPGGSAQVSQLLWREWMIAAGKIRPEIADVKDEEREALPVYISQGNVAASGGYYLSAVGDKVFSTPMSITGSIGVVGGKFNVAPLLKKWGVTIDRAPKKNPSPAFSAFSDFSGEHKEALRENMHGIYSQFLRDVALGRKRKQGEIEPHASGRVFSGKKALSLGLTDALGGISDALQSLKTDLGLTPASPLDIVILPAVKESLFNRSLLPFGLSRLIALADFAKPGIYALDPRFLRF